MKEITILDEMPFLLTKDKDWKPNPVGKAGTVIFLPEDAILVIKPPLVEVKDNDKTTKTD